MLLETVKKILEHALKVAEKINKKDLDKIIELLTASKSIFVLGSGRSKLVGEEFAMRLAQLELNVHVIGDSTTITPREGDLIIVISSSGDTSSIITEARRLKKKGVNIIGITANPRSELSKLSDIIIDVGPWRDYQREIKEEREDNITLLGTLYEDTSLLILDGIISELMRKVGKTEGDLAEAHY
ncbi:MAG: 6-phospho 3-hexuloisomerase [Methanobacteriaceae archaeon 41_258]|nr:MAG: 6-phospho 3-hexuloisomerase [Methanobacteriaceae archaeon 41_258]